MALHGDLSDFPLPDLIQLLSLSKKTGAVHIQGQRSDGEHEAWLYFDNGTIIHARLGRFSPLEAAYSLFTFPSGAFEFEEGVQPERRTITQSNEVIIMEGINRQETWTQIEPDLPDPSVIMHIVPNPPNTATDIEIEGDVWRVLTMIDGKRSIGQVAVESQLGEAATAAIVVRLLEAGLIAERTETASETLFPALEQLVSSTLGAQAVMMLNECYRLAGLTNRTRPTHEQLTKALRAFGVVSQRRFGAERAAPVNIALQQRVDQYLTTT